jgi:membrane protein YdbS with pleckstrin-like domain
LRQVQNVDAETSFLGNLLGYGTVTIQTAGAEGTIRFDRLGDPNRLKAVVFEERSKNQMQYRASGKMAIQNILEERLGLTLEMPPRTRPESDAPDEAEPTRARRSILRHLFTDRYLQWQEGDSIVWRKHWFVLLAKLMVPLFIFLAGVMVTVVFLSPALLLGPFGVSVSVGLASGAGVVTLGALAWCVWVYADWRNDSYRIESDQIIDVEKKPLFFSEERRTALLGDIENVKLRIPTPVHYLLNFGDVELQTAAADGDLTFDSVPQPRLVAEEVRRRIENYHWRQEQARARQRAEELPDWFEMYNRLDANRPFSARERT